MPVVISSDLLVAPIAEAEIGINANNPRIGIQNISSQETISDSLSQLSSNPAWLTGTPNTYERWKTVDAGAHVWQSDVDAVPVDYIGIAAHKGLIGKSVRVIIQEQVGINQTVAGPFSITSNDPVMVLFEEKHPISIVLVIQDPSFENFSIEIGNIYVGKTVTLPRRIYVNHTPITYGRNAVVSQVATSNGNLLDPVLRSVSLESSVSMDNIPPDYYRSKIHTQFALIAESGTPFFWAWRPQKYPNETGFCQMTSGSFSMSNSRPNGFCQMGFSMKGFSSDGQN